MTTVYHRMGKCPRCGKVWEFFNTDEIDCDCHMYCDLGDKPSDCVTILVSAGTPVQAGIGTVKWPFGIHDNPEQGGQDVLHRVRYCTTHDRYIEKPPLLVKCFEGDRYPSRYRWHRGET